MDELKMTPGGGLLRDMGLINLIRHTGHTNSDTTVNNAKPIKQEAK